MRYKPKRTKNPNCKLAMRRNFKLFSVLDIAGIAGVARTLVKRKIAAGVMPERTQIGKLWYWTDEQLAEVVRLVREPEIRKPVPYVSKNLSESQYRELINLAMSGVPQCDLAKRFPLSQAQISRVVCRYRYENRNNDNAA